MKRSALFALLLPLLLFGCTRGTPPASTAGQDTTAPTNDAAEVSTINGFHVDGTVLRDANGAPFLMRGINHMHTWYPDEAETALGAIAAAGCNCVRLVLSDGETWTRTEAAEVARLIDCCKENDLIAILEVHDATGKNAISDLEAAAQYFIDIKDVLIGQEAYVIINIANEWPGAVDTPTWKTGYMRLIPLLREAGLNHAIMVDCNGYGQSGRCMQRAGAEILEADPLKNVLFSLHVYQECGTSAERIEKNIRYATDPGLCLCIGEFGYLHGGRTINVDFLLSYCRENEIGYLAWCWKGNGSPSEHLDMSYDWAGTDLSPLWGIRVIDGTDGIRETSQICSIFTDNY